MSVQRQVVKMHIRESVKHIHTSKHVLFVGTSMRMFLETGVLGEEKNSVYCHLEQYDDDDDHEDDQQQQQW